MGIVTPNTPVHNEQFVATCEVSFVAAVPLNLVAIEWMTENGASLVDIDDRVQVAEIQQRNNTTFTRSVTVNPVRIEDGGTYICEAAVMGEFITSQSASESVNITVFGKPI